MFRDDGPRLEHAVTLTGWAGGREDIVIDAGEFQRTVPVEF